MSIVYTIGYEGTDIDKFVATLLAVGVKVIADVRALALSRKKGFSKTALRAKLAEVGIEYIHFSALGDPKPGRVAARAGLMVEFERIYRNHVGQQSSLVALSSLEDVVWNSPTCLLCFERDPAVCHRSIVAEKLKLNGISVFDLFGDNPSRYDHHIARIPRHHPRESSAAA
jgi:uncharacterized protein (DUF488 family)